MPLCFLAQFWVVPRRELGYEAGPDHGEPGIKDGFLHWMAGACVSISIRSWLWLSWYLGRISWVNGWRGKLWAPGTGTSEDIIRIALGEEHPCREMQKKGWQNLCVGRMRPGRKRIEEVIGLAFLNLLAALSPCLCFYPVQAILTCPGICTSAWLGPLGSPRIG